MNKTHLHLPDRMHLHRPDWHILGVHLREMTHDPRFWAVLALVVLFGLMILTALLSKGTPMKSGNMNPYNPYWP